MYTYKRTTYLPQRLEAFKKAFIEPTMRVLFQRFRGRWEARIVEYGQTTGYGIGASKREALDNACKYWHNR